MPAALTLIDAVAWQGDAVVGDRQQRLLAALVDDPVEQSSARLVESVWADAAPAHPAKALQVLVSRVRSACAPEVVASTSRGYRLGLARADVDALALADEVAEARTAMADGRVGDAARITSALLHTPEPGARDDGPLGHVRARVVDDLRVVVRIHALALSASGEHAVALPELEAEHEHHPDDEEVLDALLRSEAAVRGHGAALARYEQHRASVRDALGTDPGERLRRTHAELLARDAPVRSGLRYEADALIGRDADVDALRGLVASARVTSVLGPGGLGKTRLAQLLARTADQPVVHVVELVGVGSPDDVVGEVGAALGVRESVADRTRLTPEQRADVRARTAAQLGVAPSLLVLDNCEHVVDAVADLVAFLVATVPDLRVLTTTRAPLGIAAEHVYALGTLSDEHAAELFAARARAARPSVALDAGVVRELVARLDGLPLAVELAAARVRAMSVEEIRRRLDDRFALLRGGDPTAPDRHRTLVAVIEWSWNLLDASQQRALRRLALFGDGFCLDAAEEVLGGRDPVDLLTSLADQSLVVVQESVDALRYRMLETIREFGLARLDESEDADAARAAQRGWATGLARATRDPMHGPGVAEAMRRLAPEEPNLTDALRAAIGDGDRDAVVDLAASLIAFWTIRGDQQRIATLSTAVADVLVGVDPDPDRRDATLDVLAALGVHAVLFGRRGNEVAVAEVRRLRDDGLSPRVRALVRLVLRIEGPHEAGPGLEELSAGDDRDVALAASGWLAFQRENDGDPAGGVAAVERALSLWVPDDGPAVRAALLAELASMRAQIGDPDGAEGPALEALDLLREVGAADDVGQTLSLLALVAMHHGRFDEAKRLLDEARATMWDRGFGGQLVSETGYAELALARGDESGALLLFDQARKTLGAVRFPGHENDGYEPWILFADAAGLAVHARFGPDPDPVRDELDATVLARARGLASRREAFVDHPILGLMLHALAVAVVRRDHAVAGGEQAARLLALAEAHGFVRSMPSVSPAALAARIEELAPGTLAVRRVEVAGRRAPDLRDEVVVALAALPTAR